MKLNSSDRNFICLLILTFGLNTFACKKHNEKQLSTYVKPFTSLNLKTLIQSEKLKGKKLWQAAIISGELHHLPSQWPYADYTQFNSNFKKLSYLKIKEDNILEELSMLKSEDDYDQVLFYTWLVEYINYKSIIQELDTVDLAWIEDAIDELKDKNTTLAYYLISRLYIAQGKYFSSIDNKIKSKACYAFSLHVLYSQDLKLSKIIGNAKLLLGNLLVEDNPESTYTALSLYLESILHYEDAGFQDELYYAKNYEIIAHRALLNNDKVYSLSTDLIKEEITDPFVKNFTAINLGFMFMDTLPERSIELFDRSLSAMSDDPCNWLRARTISYKAMVMGMMGQIKEALSYIDQELNNSSCENHHKISFFRSQTRASLLTMSSASKDEIVQELINERNAAKAFFQNEKEYHLQDYYLQNLSSILSLKTNINLKEKERNQLARLITYAKQKEFNRKRRNNNETQDSEINKLLKEVNDFKKTDDFSDPAFSEIYHKILAQPSDSFNEKTLTLPYPELHAWIKDNHPVIEIVQHYGKYFTVLHEPEKTIIHQSTANIDSLAATCLSDIRDKKDVSETLHKIRTELKLPEESKSKKFVFIPDGSISLFPLELLMPESRLIIQENLLMAMEADKVTITDPSIHISSYSDSVTLKNQNVLKYPELPYGLRECRWIEEFFLPESTSLNYGTEMKADWNTSADIVHISSHASNDKNNRLDNYILSRDKKGRPIKIYSYEIETMPLSPRVVTLSTCLSGDGVYLNGTGVFSLSRAFQVRGAQAVIASQWKVNEKVTSELMVLMYDYWTSNHTLGESLDLAKKDISSNPLYAHPFYWAGFQLRGNSDIKLKFSPI